VIAMLKEQGLAVSSAQVSTTLKAMGMRRTRRGRKARVSAVARKTTASSTQVLIEDLIAAKKLVEQLGGIEQTKTVVSALAKLT
jgi:arginine repressor